MKELLNKIPKNEIVALYFENKDRFNCGEIVGMDDEFVALHSYTPYGFPDGYLLRRLSELSRVERGSKYLSALGMLIRCNGGKSDDMLPLAGDLERAILEYSIAHNKVVSLGVDGSDELAIGRVETLGDETVNLRQYTDYGESDGVSAFYLSNILSVSVDSEDEKKIAMLSAAYERSAE